MGGCRALLVRDLNRLVCEGGQGKFNKKNKLSLARGDHQAYKRHPFALSMTSVTALAASVPQWPWTFERCPVENRS